jgi:hypothetical protein
MILAACVSDYPLWRGVEWAVILEKPLRAGKEAKDIVRICGQVRGHCDIGFVG